MKDTLKFLALGAVLILGACGDDGDKTSVVVNPNEPQQQEEEQGTFSGSTPVIINNRIDNNIKVTNRVRVQGDTVVADVDCQDAPPNVIHQQIIHIGVRCPSALDDTNADGFVDWQETQAVVGPELISLDQNLGSQENSGFPSGQSYRYSRSASLSTIRNSLPSGENFNLEGKVLVIYGADPLTRFPATVSSNGSDPVNVTIPIFCNVIQKTASSPTSTASTTTGGATGSGSTTGGTTGTTTGSTTGDASTTTTTGGTASSSTDSTSSSTTGGMTTGTASGTTTGTTGTATTGGTPGTTTGTNGSSMTTTTGGGL